MKSNQHSKSLLGQKPKDDSTPSPSLQDEDLRNLAVERMKEAFQLKDTSKWELEQQNSHGSIYSCRSEKYGKIFYFKGDLYGDAEKIINLARYSEWNSTIEELKVVQTIGEDIDIVHIVSCKLLGGLVTARELSLLRILVKQHHSYVLSSSSIEHEKIPPSDDIIRAEQGPGLYIITSVEGEPLKCHLEWVNMTDIKGWLPKTIVERAITSTMFKFISSLKKRINSSNPVNDN